MINEDDYISTASAITNDKELKRFLHGLTTPHERMELEKRIQIISMLKAGMTQHDIAKKLGVGVATVSRGYKEEKRQSFDPFFEILPFKRKNTFTFGESELNRIFKGNWQLSGGHGVISREQAISDLIAYAEEGITVLDTGDIYGDSEEIIGEFLKKYRKDFGHEKASRIRVHTKFVPDLNALEDLTFKDVQKIVLRSKQRLGVKSIDLVQFHWWDFSKGDFVEAAKWLCKLRNQGHIKEIGLTNFDCMHAQMLIDANIPFVSNQVQFSLFDPRPLNGMLEMAQKNSFAVFCYGVLAGGLIESKKDDTNRSHIKYGLVLNEVGAMYHRKILSVLEALSNKYSTSRSNIAISYALQTKGVSAVILGPRNTNHLKDINNLPELSIDDYLVLRKLQSHQRQFAEDDIYSFERITEGPHATIMKYNQNGMRL